MAATSYSHAGLYAPDLPWNVYKPDELGQSVMQFVEDHEPFFRWWAQVWYENFQFLFGNHNVRWSKRYGFAVDYDFLRQQTANFGMRSQTNIARVVVEALASLIYSNMPEWDVEAMDESNLKGKRFKKISQKLLDCLMQRLCMDQEFACAAVQYVLFGQFAFKADWDFSAGTQIEIPQWKKIRAPKFTDYMAPNPYTGGLIEVPTPLLGADGQPIMEDRWEAVVDELGRQIVNSMFTGDTMVRTLTPLEYRRELGSPGMHKTRWVEEFRLLDYDQYMDEYRDVPGATKAFKKIRPLQANAQAYGFAVRHFMRMQFTTPPTVEDSFRRSNSVFKSSMFRHKVMVVEHYDRPHRDKWKKGRRIVVCNGDATHVAPPTYRVDGKLDGWHPFVEAQWMNVAPSSISAGPLNDVVRKNRELDIKDSLTATAVRRNMGSQLLVKSGSGIDLQKFTGEPGIGHEVSDIFGARWLHDELPIPPVVATLRQQDKDDVYEVSGAGDALRGQPSTGASSGYQEKQREEREEKRLAPARKSFEFAVGRLGEKLLYCMKANVVRLDDQIMGYLKRSAAGEFTTQDVIAFLSGPMTMGVDIKVKKSSMALKSRATVQATLQELAKGPLGQRLSMDARVLDKYLKYFDVDTLRDASAVHRDRAERENETFSDFMRLGPDGEGLMWPVVMFEDDDDIHEGDHALWALQNAEELLGNEYMLLRFLQHMERHRLQRIEKQGELMPGASLQTATMQQAARQQPPPNVQQIYQRSMMDQQTKQLQAAQPQPQQAAKPGGPAPTGGQQAPQAPRPGGKTDPQAPSGNTPPAMAKGGM
jgi:hypothetical protein